MGPERGERIGNPIGQEARTHGGDGAIENGEQRCRRGHHRACGW